MTLIEFISLPAISLLIGVLVGFIALKISGYI